ncbi:acyl-CoA dehydrogenase family protein [Herbiconiux sp. P16]|uniref:acyl-CoA dehydrogenase family protein n=1 Tax=Herbiconiux wuyangfengii TaxID=3342794 RepID=UPI0035B8263B
MTLPPELEELKLHVRSIVEKVCFPLEPQFLRNEFPGSPGALAGGQSDGSLPDEEWERLKKISIDAGIYAGGLPEEFGGLNVGIWGDFVISEELNRSVVHLPRPLVPWILLEHGTEAQKEKYLTPTIEGELKWAFAQSEPGAGSDPGNSMSTTAEKVPGGWKINGTKMWISGVEHADWVMVQAVTDKSKRQRGGITMFLVDIPSEGLSFKGIDTWLTTEPEVSFVYLEDVFVPDENVLGEVGLGFSLGQKWLAIQDRLTRGSLATGILSRALDYAVDWAENRVTFGAPLSERQAVQWYLVDALIDLKAIRAISYETAWRADQGEDVRELAAMAKYVGGNWGHRSIDKLMQVMGGLGETKDLPFTTWYRQLRHGRIGGGTDEIQRMLMARAIFKKKSELWNA